MEKRLEQGFSWGEGNIPGRRIVTGETIVVYNDNGMPNVTAKDLVTPQPFVIPTSWMEESQEFLKNLKKTKPKEKEVIVFEREKIPLNDLLEAI